MELGRTLVSKIGFVELYILDSIPEDAIMVTTDVVDLVAELKKELNRYKDRYPARSHVNVVFGSTLCAKISVNMSLIDARRLVDEVQKYNLN